VTALSAVLTLLVIYQVKHFLADYPLQRPYMLGKFRPGWDFVGPLTAHATTHALFTFFIALVWLWQPFTAPPLGTIFGLALFDGATHFVMDRVKASPRWLGRFKALSAAEHQMYTHDIPSAGIDEAMRHNTYFWWSLGLDQMVHHLTHYAIIAYLVTA
jgi:hypothetical protein